MKLRHRLAQAARVLSRGYDAAGASGRWPLAATTLSPLASALQARPTIAARAAYLATNSPYIAAAVANMVSSFVGDGPALAHDDARLVAVWNRWWSEADAEGVSSLGALVARATRSWIIVGEAFIVLKTNPESGALRLQLIPAEQIADEVNEDRGGGAFIVSGIEVDADGRHAAVWIRPLPPDHPQAAAQAGIDPIRIPIADIVHIVEPPTPGAVRGVSPLAPVMTRALELDLTEDALIKQQQVSALLGVFVTSPLGDVTLGAVNNGSVSLEPGTVRFLPPDSMVTAVNPPQSGGGHEFQRALIRSIAAGLGVPVELVSADLSQTSFSSSRFGDRFFRRRTLQVQRLLLEPALDKVFQRFVALEALAGRLDLDLTALAPPRWLWPGFEPLEPLKDVQADTAAVAAGFASRAEIVAKRSGRDVADVDRENERDPLPLPSAPPTAPSFFVENQDA